MYEAEDRQITWEDIKKEFFDQYVPSSVKDRKAAEFLHLKQGKMTIVKYEIMFRKLFRYAPHQVANERVKLKKFQDSLAPL